MAFTILNEADVFHQNQAEPDSVDIDILVAGFSASGVVSGCAVTAQGTPDMTVAVASGTVIVAGTVAAVTGANSTIGAADGSNPRFDLITVNNSGTLATTAGTAATNPVFPAIPADSIVLAAVYVPAGDTDIDSNQITDKRVVVNFGDNSKLTLGDDADVQLYWDGTDFVTHISGSIRMKYQPGLLVAQEALELGTTTGDLTVNPAGNILLRGGQFITVGDNLKFALGVNADTVMINRSTPLAADTELSVVIEGTSNHQGVAANSFILSNITNDGDMMMLVSDGGNSLEYLRADADVATVDLGFAMLITKFMAASTTLIEGNGTGLGFFATTPAAQPTGVAVSAAGIHAALVTLGLITA